MQRVHAGNCTSAVSNSGIGGPSARDTARAESPALSATYLNSRRSSQLAPYKLKCEKEPLNSRLGPPDYHPQTPDCPEETFTREYVQSGYRETVEGLEEAREISLTQVQTFPSATVLKCKEAIRKRLRAINESRAQKRKAGQVYGVPLSGSLLNKPGAFPEQRPCGEDFRKRWIEGLSQPHKRLRSLADHIPHGYRRKSLFEILIKNNVPLLRATWFIRITYLNQVRPSSAGTPDKSQLNRTELWTKDIIEYLQYLLDEFVKNNYRSTSQLRDRSPQMVYAGSALQKSEPISSTLDTDEPSLHVKWWYVVRLLQWHYAEGLLLPSPIIEWALNQLQDKELLQSLQLLLPVIYGVIEALVLSQSYVRTLVGVAVRFIQEPSPGGSDLIDNSRRAYTCSAVVEMLRYLILAVPDTFVALDCFPLPACVTSLSVSDGSYVSKVSEDLGKMDVGLNEVACTSRRRGFDSLYQALSFNHVISSIQKRSDKLAKAVNPGYLCSNYAKAVQALDRAVLQGDLRGAYKSLFEDFSEVLDEGWIAEVNPCLRSSLKWLGTVNLSFIHSVFFLCEWATCDYRNFRSNPLLHTDFTGRIDFSQIYVAVRFLKLKMRELCSQSQFRNDKAVGLAGHRGLIQENDYFGRRSMGGVYGIGNTESAEIKSVNFFHTFESPGPLHDILVCWIDQHEALKGEGLERLQLLIVELARTGIFCPQAYARQLLVSGIMDSNCSKSELDKCMRHYQILKQLPGLLMDDAVEEARITEGLSIEETMQVYANERHLVLQELLSNKNRIRKGVSTTGQKRKHAARDGIPASDKRKFVESPSTASFVKKLKIEELKASISVLMQFKNSNSTSADAGVDESEGSVKRSSGSVCSNVDLSEEISGCEECRRIKKQKVSEERSLYVQIQSPTLSDDEDLWWVRKGSKSIESMKVDPPLKSAKQASRGRQKVVRKTQSLAQLAAARIEGSQGASTSHVCDNRVLCPHHKAGTDGEIPKSNDGNKTAVDGDIISIGRALKKLRLAGGRAITSWLVKTVRQYIEEAEKTPTKVGLGRSYAPVDDRSPSRWKLGEDELSAMLYLMDISDDLVSAIKFLLWLLTKPLRTVNSPIYSGRNMLMMQRHVESHCEVGEAYLLSSLRRYENTIVSADLIPEALSASMNRAATVVASNGRVSGIMALAYARYLFKKYSTVTSVLEWRKTNKSAYDKRLFAELESGRPLEGDLVNSLGPQAGADDLDDFLRQKITNGRLSRVGMGMREIVQRHVEEAFRYLSGKEKKSFASKGLPIEKGDDGYQIAHQMIVGLMDCIRQTGGAAQEGDPTLLSSAVSAIVGSVGPTLAKIPDFTSANSYPNFPSAVGSLSFAKCILRIHITCLCLLREALGERQSRVFEIALAAEASSALAGVFAPGKASRNQYQLSPDIHDASTNNSNESLNSSGKAVVSRATKIAAAVSSLVIGAIIQGVTSLERMVTVFRLKDNLDILQFVRTTRSNSNGNTRSPGVFKVDSSIEVYVHWFRVLIGNCRTVSDGLLVELLGEPSIVALSRMQQTLPLSLVFPPAYCLFAFLTWKPFILNANLANREDINQLYQSLNVAVRDALKHYPFRDICLRNSQGLYEIIVSDTSDAEFASMLELNGSNIRLKATPFVPLRARLFLNAILECRLPPFTHEDRSRVSRHGESKDLYAENDTKLVDKVVQVLNNLQPARFHWQWLELRLLLNEQIFIEKFENHDTSLVDALRSLTPSPERANVSDNENNFIEIVLTRLLVRPDAAPLFSEVVHLFGREDSMLLLTKWFLEGHDVLFGRKTIRQRLINIAESRGLSIKSQFWKHWGWSASSSDTMASGLGKKKQEAMPLEEGEVVEDGIDARKYNKGSMQPFDAEVCYHSQQHVTEKALIELVTPCIDQSSDESRNTFANDLIKQLSAIEQNINAIARGTSKSAGTAPSGTDGPTNKTSNRRGMRGSSPSIARRHALVTDSAPPSPAALRASISLRLQFLMRLLPVICADREASGKNMRHILAIAIFRLLGNRLVYEDADLAYPVQSSLPKEGELLKTSNIASPYLSGESLFDRLLLVFHGLLGSSQPSWLKARSTKSGNDLSKEFYGVDREIAESLQNDLESMQLPDKIRWRIQAAMPTILPSVRCSVSCQPPSISAAAIASLQPSISFLGSVSGNPSHRNSGLSVSRSLTSIPEKSMTLPAQQDHNVEIDAWTLLEDGVGSSASSSSATIVGSGDNSNLRAASWLKGAVRVRRTDLMYIGAVDEDS